MQEHFEAEEGAIVSREIRRKQHRSKETTTKNVLENGLKAEKGLVWEDDDEEANFYDDGDDALDEAGEIVSIYGTILRRNPYGELLVLCVF